MSNNMSKMKAAIIGTGNIGCDLMIKILRSPFLDCTLMAGRDMNSRGSRFSLENKVNVSDLSVRAIQENPDICQIVFDATSAAVHLENLPTLSKLGKFVIDLTPAKVGMFCVPVINLDEALSATNVNMVTCGGQTSIPIAFAITQAHPETRYIEIVSTIASCSAGIGTRDNIDEFIRTTNKALSYFTGVKKTKAIIILNPAEPPINMRTTVHALIDFPDLDRIRNFVFEISEKVKKYVPGYKIIVEPNYDGSRVSTTIEVTGLGDYLPTYAGNLDITTCAAIRVAEAYAQKGKGMFI